MDSNPSSHWHALFESVKSQIPSIDPDSSSSDNEEDISIFQRSAFILPKHTQDVLESGEESCLLESLSLEDAEIEEPETPAAPQTCWTTSCKHSDNADEALESTVVAQSSSDVEIDACENNISEVKGATANSSVTQYPGNSKPDECFLTLSFTLLEHLDLNEVFLGEDRPSIPACVSSRPVETHADSDKKAQEDIMDKLVALSKQQSSGDESKSGSQPESDQSPIPFRENSMWRKSFERMAADMQLSPQESPTVHIDLRCPETSINTQRTCLSISSESEKLAGHKLHEENPLAKETNLGVHPGSPRGDGEVTGKSMLLQTLSVMKRNGNERLKKYTHPQVSVLGHQREEGRDKPTQHSATRNKVQPPLVDKQSSPVQCESKKPEERTATQQGTTTEQPKQQSFQSQRQQHKQTLQYKQHQQILKQLESHRPTRSISYKQPAAEKTDVLYDTEASHLQSISNVPSDIEDERCVLLTISLSSPGIVAWNNHRKAQKLESATTKSHIYNSLVAWFLSLVGPGPRYNENKAGADIPFWVAGLEQLWREDGLALHVLAVSHGENPKRCPKSRKGHGDTQSTFHKRVCGFLSQTSLSVITHWLPQLRTLLDHQAYPTAIHLPSSCLNCFISVSSDKMLMDRTFGLSPGFYWQTLETQEPTCKRPETMGIQQLHTEVAVALGFKAFFLQPLVTHHTLQLLLDSGLDVCGLRLLYPPPGLLRDSTGCVQNIQGDDGAFQPLLALAVRGPYACDVWQEITGPSDPLLARRTDPASINALHCSSKDLPLFHSPRLASLVHMELCLWFAGRLQGGNSQNLDQALNNRVSPPSEAVGSSLAYQTRSSATLCATTQADVLLVVSPAVAPCCYSQVLAVCERRGFSLRGLQRKQLLSKWAQALGLTSQQALVFCSPPTVTMDQEKVQLSSHCLVLLLRRENVSCHCASLPAALLREFEAQKLLGCIRLKQIGDEWVDPSCCFHILPYSANLPSNFGMCLWEVPEPSRVVLSNRRYPYCPETEQVVILTLCGKDMSRGLSLLHRVLRGGPEGDAGNAGYELLALKWLPSLTRRQAQELSPYEVGDRLWPSSLVSLASSPALVCALRRVDAFSVLQKLLPHGNLSVLMSPTPELAFRQVCLFFTEREMIPDNSVRPLLKFLPPPRNTTGSQRESLFCCMVQDPQPLLTLCLFKPRVWNHALAKILCKVQKSGFTVVGLRVVVLDKTDAASLVSVENDPTHFEGHVHYMCSGPSLALCLQRENAVKRLLDLLGPEDQAQARAQDQFLWRACYGTDSLHSGIYGSGSYQRAIQDVKRLFPEGLCCTETNTMIREQIISMYSDPLACLAREQSHTLAAVAKERTVSLLMASGLNGGSLVNSALCQTTCLLVPSNVLQLSQVPSYLNLLEQLLIAGCHLVAGRMSILDKAQRQHITETLALPSGSNGMMLRLHEGSCLVIALQRDNVVSCFDLILERIYRESPDLKKVGEMIIYPRTEKEAKNLLCYLFDVLSPESHHAILAQGSDIQPS